MIEEDAQGKKKKIHPKIKASKPIMACHCMYFLRRGVAAGLEAVVDSCKACGRVTKVCIHT